MKKALKVSSDTASVNLPPPPREVLQALPWTSPHSAEQELYFEQSFARSAKKCATILLGPANKDGNASHFLAQILTACCTRTVYKNLPKERWKESIPLFALSAPDESQNAVREGREILLSVIEGTSIALPANPATGEVYVPLSEGRRLTYPVTLEGVKKSLDSTPITPPAPLSGPAYADRAKRALAKEFNPLAAELCLRRQPIALIPAPTVLTKAVDYEHDDTNKKFREAAIQACLNKWSSVIPPNQLKAFFLQNAYDSHHRWPKFWGGGNKSRTLCNLSLHHNIHEDFDGIVREVETILKQNNAPVTTYGVADETSMAALQKFLVSRKDVCADLQTIKHVTVKNGIVFAGILWPEEKFCVPQLMIFEFLNKAPCGPYVVEEKCEPFLNMAARSKSGAPKSKYFAPRKNFFPSHPSCT